MCNIVTASATVSCHEHNESLRHNNITFQIWHSEDRASWYIRIIEANKMHYTIFLNFIFIHNSTCFGQTYCPSSGVLMLYLQQLVFVILFMLTVCPTVNINSMTNTICCESWWWTVSLSQTCRVVYQNKAVKQRIFVASIIRITFQVSWISVYIYL